MDDAERVFEGVTYTYEDDRLAYAEQRFVTLGLLREIVVSIEPLTEDVAERAARLRARHRSLRLPDALVLAIADALDATVLTCDRAWKHVTRRARVV
jgi:predicted nucleic acid-binding protein